MLFIPEKIQNIIENITNHGFEAYIVGGCVRDMLMDIAPHDYDITTSATPEEIMQIFPKTVPTGIKHGTVTVINEGVAAEVTTFRADGVYSDHRRPENVTFVRNLEEDLKRRDFTVNAMAYNAKEGLKDFFGGETDIKNKILKTVGEPEKRFTEDALRILRLFRFSSTLGFETESETLKSATELSFLLKEISVERILSELKKTLEGENPQILKPLIETGNLNFLGIEKCPDFEKIKSLKHISLFVFLYSANADILKSLEILKVSNKEKKQAENLLKLINMPFPENKADIKNMLFKTDISDFNNYLDFQKIFFNAETEETLSELNEITENNEPYRIRDLKIGGDTLTNLGIKGEKVGQILEELRKKVVSEPAFNVKSKLTEAAQELNRN